MNQHFYVRQGVGFKEMTEPQREAAFALLRAGLSAKGLKLTRDIMRLNHTLGELNGNNFVEYGEWLYWITIMGQPSATEPWGWQLDGHHAIVNYFVLGDQVVMTPDLPGLGAGDRARGQVQGRRRPADGAGQGAGPRCGPSPTRSAPRPSSRSSKTGNDNVGEAFKDNVVLDYAGLPASELTEAQKTAAPRPGRRIRGEHGRRPRAGEDGRGARAPGPDAAWPGSAAPTPTASSTTGSTAR